MRNHEPFLLIVGSSLFQIHRTNMKFIHSFIMTMVLMYYINTIHKRMHVDVLKGTNVYIVCKTDKNCVIIVIPINKLN